MCCRRVAPYEILDFMHPSEKDSKVREHQSIEEGSPREKARLARHAESACRQRELQADSALARSQPGCARQKCCCGVVLALVFGVVAGACIMPRAPSWDLSDLRLVDVSFPEIGESASGVKLHFEVTATVSNPYYIDMTTERGVFSIFYQGELIGTADIPKLSIGGQSKASAPVSVTADNMSPDLGIVMMKDLAEKKGFLEVEGRGLTVTKVLAALDVECTAMCHLTADVKHLPEFRERACTSDCSLWSALPAALQLPALQ